VIPPFETYTEMAQAMRAFDPVMEWAVRGGSTRRDLLALAPLSYLNAEPRLSRKRTQRTLAKFRASRPPLAAPLNVRDRLNDEVWQAQA
jgi:hypothetical protein